MTDEPMTIATVTITKAFTGDGSDISLKVDTEPDDLALIDILGMLAFAQHSVALDAMEVGDDD